MVGSSSVGLTPRFLSLAFLAIASLFSPGIRRINTMSAGAMTTHRHDETRVSATNTISRATSENSSTVIVLLKAFGENGDGRFLRGRVDSAPPPFSRSKRFEKNQSHYNSLSRSWEASDFPRLSSAWWSRLRVVRFLLFRKRLFSMMSLRRRFDSVVRREERL